MPPARFTLIVNQRKSDGTLCQTSTETFADKTFPYAVHHAYVPLNKANFAIGTAAGCIPRFNAYVRVDWKSGQTGGSRARRTASTTPPPERPSTTRT
jgi:hypothetical protein